MHWPKEKQQITLISSFDIKNIYNECDMRRNKFTNILNMYVKLNTASTFFLNVAIQNSQESKRSQVKTPLFSPLNIILYFLKYKKRVL